MTAAAGAATNSVVAGAVAVGSEPPRRARSGLGFVGVLRITVGDRIRSNICRVLVDTCLMWWTRVSCIWVVYLYVFGTQANTCVFCVSGHPKVRI